MIVYMHTSPSGKSYIGQTKHSMEHRWKGHIREWKYKKKHNKLRSKFHNAFDAYPPDNWQHKILFESSDYKEILIKEKEYIKYFDTVLNGYNICTEGTNRLNVAHTDETKRKISRAKIGRSVHTAEQKLIYAENLRNKNYDPEYKQKIKKGNKKRWSDPHKKTAQSNLMKETMSKPENFAKRVESLRSDKNISRARNHMKQNYLNTEFVESLRKGHQEFYKNPENKQKAVQANIETRKLSGKHYYIFAYGKYYQTISDCAYDLKISYDNARYNVRSGKFTKLLELPYLSCPLYQRPYNNA